jgi:predicted dithiol-disulfide oxidoreductase (DUF899 family)
MNTHDQHHFPTDSDTPALPAVVDRATWQTELDKLRVREKAHTREGDAISAARRRLPMVEVDPTIQLLGPHGPITLLSVFKARSLLIVYFHMWHTGQPASAQCEGCTFSNSQVRELSYLHSRDVTYATFCEGPYEQSICYRNFMGWDVLWYSAQDAASALFAEFGMLVCYLRHGDRVFEAYWTAGRGNEVMAPSYGLLDRAVYGRQETWEDSPAGWPQRWGSAGGWTLRRPGHRGYRLCPRWRPKPAVTWKSAPTWRCCLHSVPHNGAPLQFTFALSET